MQIRLLFPFLLLLAVAGCKVDTMSDPASALPGPAGLEASSVGPDAVRLRWPATSGAAYKVHWEAVDEKSDSGFVVRAETELVVDGLISGRVYRFTMTPLRDGRVSDPITGASLSIEWAPASRYGGGAFTSGATIAGVRLYEPGSDSSGGLLLDPQLGGPLRVGINGGSLAAQLAVWTSSASSNVFSIGPAYAFPSYRNSPGFMVDSTVAISVSTQLATSLDTWYSSRSIASFIDPDGAHKAYSFAALQPDTLGQGFFVRTGHEGAYHYARVLIRNVEGRLLQGTPPNRYVALDISYQTTPNVPYARAARRDDPPVGVPALRP
jgi:hypothetical protein